jgi:hypothetical protein
VHVGEDEVAASWHAMEDEVATSCSCTWCTAGCTCGITHSLILQMFMEQMPTKFWLER